MYLGGVYLNQGLRQMGHYDMCALYLILVFIFTFVAAAPNQSEKFAQQNAPLDLFVLESSPHGARKWKYPNMLYYVHTWVCKG